MNKKFSDHQYQKLFDIIFKINDRLLILHFVIKIYNRSMIQYNYLIKLLILQ